MVNRKTKYQLLHSIMYEIITFPCKVELAPHLPCLYGALAPSLFARATQTFFFSHVCAAPPLESLSVRPSVRPPGKRSDQAP